MFKIKELYWNILHHLLRHNIKVLLTSSYCEGIRKGWNLHEQYVKGMMDLRAIALSRNPVDKEVDKILNETPF